MIESAVQQLAHALRQIEAFSQTTAPDGRRIPRLPGPADEALMAHLARGVRGARGIRAAGTDDVRTADVIEALRELRAAVALLQEWVVPDVGPP